MRAIIDLLYINARQGKRLVTHEDARFMHAHKVLGVLALAHFVWRIGRLVRDGGMGFDGGWGTLVGIGVHAGLHVTSFYFVLPSRRNKVYNVIWPEMRWHTMIFAYRSVMVCLLLWARERWEWPWWPVDAGRGALVFVTMLCADWVTRYYKAKNQVDAADSTMRGNPYPGYAPGWVVKGLNYFYSASQIVGTFQIFNNRNMEAAFLILLPIQMAPFLMTLEKKGIIRQAGWHFWYVLALLVNWAQGVFREDDGKHDVFPAMVMRTMAAVVVGLRFFGGVNKYVLWGAVWAAYAAFAVASEMSWSMFRLNSVST